MKTKYFIGKTKVKDCIVHENTDLVGVLLDNGKSEDYTNEQWVNIRSEKPYEDGLISMKKYEKTMQRMMKEMIDSRVTVGDIAFILGNLQSMVEKSYRDAIAKTFSQTFTEKIMLAQIQKTLE